MSLEARGYHCAKIWAFAPVVYSTSSSKLITIPDKKNISPTGKIDWGYHVAPILQVRIGNKVRKMVVDPGLFKTPVRYRTWLTKLKTKQLIYLIVDSEWYLFNSSLIPNSELHPYDESLDANSSNVKLPDSFSDKLITDFFKYEDEALNQHWIEKGLAINETAITFFNNEIKPILNSKQLHEVVSDYKLLVGNVFNFETIFRDNNWNYEMNDDFQSKHQEIISKYRGVYALNLKKWQDNLELIFKNLKTKNRYV